MARIVHRHRLPSLGPPQGIRRLPVVGRVFLLLAGVVAVIEIWPALNAAWLVGVTDVLSGFAEVLPTAFRNAAIVALPAAVLWARPRAPRINPWLWKGALIIALVQLLRYPVELVQDALFEVDALVAYSVVAMILAFATTLGIWALSEGMKDAGARLASAVIAALAVAVLAFVVIVFGESVALAVQGGVDPQLAANLVALLGNGLYLFTLALLAARAVAGVIGGLDPRTAWRAGAVAAVSIAILPVASLALTLAGSMSGEGTPELGLIALRVAVFVGWPLLAIALGMGMGALPRRSGFRARRYRLGSATRVVQVAAPQPVIDEQPAT